MTPDPSIQARRPLAPARRVLAAIALAVSLPAAAYVPPATAILKRTAQHRDELKLNAVEARGTVTFSGSAADRVRAAGIDPSRPVPATFLMKVPGRCRLELAPDGTPPSQRPSVTLRTGRVSGVRGLQELGAARALVEAVCTLLAERGTSAEPERGLTQRLAERGVDLHEVGFGRFQGRVAWVLGGKPQDDRPQAAAQAWIDKQTFDPLRLVLPVAGASRDVRFLPAAGAAERFPRTIEVWSGGQLEARLQSDAVTANPKLPDAAFP